MSRLQRLAALVLWGLVVLVVGAAVGGGAIAGGGTHRAGLVVVDEAGAMQRLCVEFTEDDISGVELLRRSGLAVVFSSGAAFGEGVCSLDGTGCNDPGDCFCQCRGADCAYWAYFGLGDDGWRFQAIGPSQRRLHDGDVDAWIWGAGRVPPDPVTLADACPMAQAAPTATIALPSGPASAPTPVIAEQPTAGAFAATATAPPIAESTLVSATPPLPDGDERVVARPDDEGDELPAADSEVDEGDGGVPAGLIAFGAVAGGLIAVAGALTLRRRLRG